MSRSRRTTRGSDLFDPKVIFWGILVLGMVLTVSYYGVIAFAALKLALAL